MMDQQILKKGTVQKIDDDMITILNDAGQCEDKLAIFRQDAEAIRGLFSPGANVFYVLAGERLLGIGLEEHAPEHIGIIYEASPKEKGCVTTS